MEQAWVVLLAFGIPTGMFGFAIWCIQRIIIKGEKRREAKLDKEEKHRLDIERSREDHQFMLLQSTYASISLGEATAIAIKNGKTNGEMCKALEYAKTIKHDQEDYLRKIALKGMY